MKKILCCLCLGFFLAATIFGQRVGIATSSPTHDLHLLHSNGAGSTNNSQGLKLQNAGSNGASWTLYVVNNGRELWIYSGTNNVGRFLTTGAYTVISDERFKKNIASMGDVLPDVLKLEPHTYSYIHQNNADSPSIGFLAQSVVKVFPQLVNQSMGDDNKLTYAIDYTGFSVVAIKAIQEQQKIIEEQKALLQTLLQEVNALKAHIGL